MEKPGYLKKGKNWIIGQLSDWMADNGVVEEDIISALNYARYMAKKKHFNDPETFNKIIAPKIAKEVTKPFKSTVWGQKMLKAYKDNLRAYNPNNVLAIADMHEPFCVDGYLEHCMAIRDKYDCGTIVLIGDEVDLCGIGQWEKDPDGFSAGTEATKAQERMKLWYEAFPSAKVCIGNHTARPFRMARANGIPKKFLKTYEEAWEAPSTWQWADSWEINGVHYTHGTGFSGANAAIRIATRHRQNTVIGHIHSEAGIQYSASKIDLVWGMQLGGALNDKSYAAYYAKDQLKKSIVGCGVVLNGTLPIYEPMKL